MEASVRGAPSDWRARHFEAGSAESREAVVRFESGALVVIAGGADRAWPLAAVVLVDAGGRAGPVQLELRGERVEAVRVEGEGFLAALEAAGGKRELKRLGGSRDALRLLAILGALGIAAVVAAWIWGLPALAGFAARQVPPEWERRYGAMALGGMVPPERRVRDPRVTGPVERTFAALLAHRPPSRDSFQVIVAREALVNAFAAPGGFVVVTTGLLRALDDSEELAAVMAHEITHVVERHSTRQLFARLGVRAMIAMIAGDYGVAGSLAGAAGTLGELSYSRHDETEADLGAVRLLARAGVEPRAMDRALERIAGASGESGPALSFLSTHPGTADRRERVRALAAGVSISTPAVLPGPAEWDSMRRALH